MIFTTSPTINTIKNGKPLPTPAVKINFTLLFMNQGIILHTPVDSEIDRLNYRLLNTVPATGGWAVVNLRPNCNILIYKTLIKIAKLLYRG